MKKIIISFVLSICLILALVGCDNKYSPFTVGASAGTTASVKPLSAGEITSKLQDAHLPITGVVVYTDETDDNKLLGRPNQYISKANFADTRLSQVDITDPDGGSVETFKNASNLTARKTYIEKIFKDSPMFTEYLIVNGNYLLRLNKDLTAAQVEEYKTAFMAVE